MKSATLVLATGELFSGLVPDWCHGHHFGEVVFTTSMVGYEETLTDPSYKQQLVAFTYPLIGNYGVWNQTQWESNTIHAAGVIISSYSELGLRSQAEHDFVNWCKLHQIPVIFDIDTRALTKVIRDHGAVAGAIACEEPLPAAFPDINQTNLVEAVSIKEPIESGQGAYTVVVVDCGIKANILRLLENLPIKLVRVPFDFDYSQLDFDAVFLSNGPGDPELCKASIDILKTVIQADQSKPIFGICLGAQILALAAGAKTYKLRFGHRGQNQPVQAVDSQRCYLTSQNHGFAIEEASLPEEWQVSFRHLNDATVQGIEHASQPFSAVQFHPEACPGPTDTQWLFEQFYQQIIDAKESV